MNNLINNFIFSPVITIADVMSVLAFLALVISGIFALYQWRENIKLKRAEYIKTLLTELRANDKIVFYLFDYDMSWYRKAFHNGGELEAKVDYTLSFLSYICYLHQQNIISDNEFDCFKYELDRVLTNEQFKSYFYNIYHFSTKLNKPISFLHLFTYAKDNGYFDDEFWNISSTRYPHYLNF